MVSFQKLTKVRRFPTSHFGIVKSNWDQFNTKEVPLSSCEFGTIKVCFKVCYPALSIFSEYLRLVDKRPISSIHLSPPDKGWSEEINS